MNKAEYQAVIDTFQDLVGVIAQIHKMIEVQNAILLEMGSAVIALQVSTGNLAGATKLGDKFAQAAEVLRAGK